MYEDERWVPLMGYEGRYIVSDYGRVKRLWDSPDSTKGRKRKSFDKIFEPHPGNNGYMRTSYGMEREYTHRLVARHFIDNPNNLPEVNHIDGNKKNNYYKNLEWCSRKENCEHASRTGLINRDSIKRKEACKANRQKALEKNKKPVLQLDFSGHVLNRFDSIADAANVVGVRNQLISETARQANNHKSAGGFQWVYEAEYDPLKNYIYSAKH